MLKKNFGEMSTDDGHKVNFSGQADISLGLHFFCIRVRRVLF